MCRYGFTECKNKYACFKCQKGIKQRLNKDLLSLKELKILNHNKFENILYKKQPLNQTLKGKSVAKCPACEGEIVNFGKDLRLPKKDKQEELLAIEYLANKNFNFFTCGCHGIGIVPQNLQDTYKLVEERRNKTAGKKLLEKMK